MQNCQVKIAKPADLPQLVAVHAECFDKPWKPEQFNFANEINLLAVSIGISVYSDTLPKIQPTNYTGICAYSSIVDEVEIKTLGVITATRRTGVAKVFVRHILDRHKNARVFLEVAEKNIPAINLYKSFGFEQYSLRKNYYSDGDNAILMQKFNSQ